MMRRYFDEIARLGCEAATNRIGSLGREEADAIVEYEIDLGLGIGNPEYH